MSSLWLTLNVTVAFKKVLFSVFYSFEMGKNSPDKSVTTTAIRRLLPDVLPSDLPSYITHRIVKKRIHVLRSEFEFLLDDIRRGTAQEANVSDSTEHSYKIDNFASWIQYTSHHIYLQRIFMEYKSRFPLDCFIAWFLKWAQNLLRRFQELSHSSATDSKIRITNVSRYNATETIIEENDCIGVTSTPPLIRKEGNTILNSSKFATTSSAVCDSSIEHSRRKKSNSTAQEVESFPLRKVSRKNLDKTASNERGDGLALSPNQPTPKIQMSNQTCEFQKIGADRRFIVANDDGEDALEYSDRSRFHMDHAKGRQEYDRNESNHTPPPAETHTLKVVIPATGYKRLPLHHKPIAVTVEKYLASRLDSFTGVTKPDHLKDPTADPLGLREVDTTDVNKSDKCALDIASHLHPAFNVTCDSTEKISAAIAINGRLDPTLAPKDTTDSPPSKSHQGEKHPSSEQIGAEGISTLTAHSSDSITRNNRSPDSVGKKSSSLPPAFDTIEYYESASDTDTGSEGDGIAKTFCQLAWSIFEPQSQ